MIAENLKQVLSELPEKVRLVAVSKFHPNEAIEEAYRAGQRVFGESKVQEMTAKCESLPKDIEWHFIGHLQTNKIKYIVPYVALIHGIDSYKLLAEVDKQAAKAGKTVNCLLQLHIAREETKFGFSFDECREMLAAGEWRELKHIRICFVIYCIQILQHPDTLIILLPGLMRKYAAAYTMCPIFALKPAFKIGFRRKAHQYISYIKYNMLYHVPYSLLSFLLYYKKPLLPSHLIPILQKVGLVEGMTICAYCFVLQLSGNCISFLNIPENKKEILTLYSGESLFYLNLQFPLFQLSRCGMRLPLGESGTKHNCGRIYRYTYNDPFQYIQRQ